jgi:hypothetical protein
MKRIFLFLALIVPFFFCSCSDEDTSGDISATVKGTSYSYKACTFLKKDGKTYITSTQGDNTLTIIIDTTILKIGKYTLGYFGSITDVADLSPYVTTMLTPKNLANKNHLVFYPNGAGAAGEYLSLFGTVTFTNITESKLEGEFTGFGMDKNVMPTIPADTLAKFTNALSPFSGKFTARSWGEE